MGVQALYSNTTGSNNNAVGLYSMISNTTGSNNVALGYFGLYGNTTGNSNVAIGFDAQGSGTSGNSNIAIGPYALNNNSSVSNQVAIGDSAMLHFNGTTGGNTALGSKTLYNTNSGYYNTASGFQALYTNTSGALNTANGYQSLYSLTTGTENTAFGYSSLPSVTTGADNVAVGGSAGSVINTGSFNTDIGMLAYATSDVSNYTGIGYDVGSGASTSNMVEIGDGSVTVIRGQVGFSTYSDGRVKDDVQQNVHGLDFINSLRPVTYHYNIHRENEMMFAGSNKPEPKDYEGKYDIEKLTMSGFIAQEVESAANHVGYDFSGVVKPANANDLYSLRYSDFVVPLVKSVQELSQQNEELKALIEKLNKRIDALENK